MATVYKVLGQLLPSAATATTLYTVPASTSVVASTLSICNQGATGITVRVAVRPAGATLAAVHYVLYEAALGAYETLTLTLGITLATTDVVTVYSSVATTSFHLYGSELT